MEAKNALQALIENGGWRPIEEAKDSIRYLFKCQYEHSSDYGYLSGYWYANNRYEKNITHFLPLDTPERMARIIGAMMEALESIQSDSGTIQLLSNPPQHTWKRTAEKALQQCQKIAEGE